VRSPARQGKGKRNRLRCVVAAAAVLRSTPFAAAESN
jgi:hypothetical protein